MTDIVWGDRFDWSSQVASVDDASDMYPRDFYSCQMDANTFVVAFGVQAASGQSDDRQGRAFVAKVSSDGITFHDYVEFLTAGNIRYEHSVRCAKLDATRFVVTYAKQVDSAIEHMYAKIGTISGTTISFGTEVDVSGQLVYLTRHCLVSLGSDKFAVSYCEVIDAAPDTYKGIVVICTVSGTTITAGSPGTFLDEKLSTAEICKLGTDSLLIVYRGTVSVYTYGIVDTISTRTSSFGSSYLLIDDFTVTTNRIELLSTGRVLMAYNTNGAYVTAKGLIGLLTISGTVISKGADIEFQAAAGNGQGPHYPFVIIIDSRTFVIIYSDGSPVVGANGTSIYSTMLGSTITLGDKEVWESPYMVVLQSFALTTTKLAVVYSIGTGVHYAKLGIPPAYPSNPTTTLVRVTGLVHRWVPGSYTLEVLLGDVKTIWERPPLRREPLPTMYPRPELPAQTPLPYKYYKPELPAQDPLVPTPWLPGWNAPLGMPEDEWRALNQPAPETIYLLGDLSDAWRTDR